MKIFDSRLRGALNACIHGQTSLHLTFFMEKGRHQELVWPADLTFSLVSVLFCVQCILLQIPKGYSIVSHIGYKDTLSLTR